MLQNSGLSWLEGTTNGLTCRLGELILSLMKLPSSVDSKLWLAGKVKYMGLLVLLLLQSIEESVMLSAAIDIGLEGCLIVIPVECCLCSLLKECDEPLDRREMQSYM